MLKVCIILLNWNGWGDTLECLNSLLEFKTVPASIVVVDNGSTDDSVAHILSWAEKRFPQVAVETSGQDDTGKPASSPPPFLLIRNSANLGFSGGNNVGISWALQQNEFDFIWLLNNDTSVCRDSLDTLLQCGKQVQAGVYGSTVVEAGDPETVQCAGGCLYNPLTTIFSPYLAGERLEKVQQGQDSAELDYIFGASLFVRAEVFQQCGLLNDDYFLFYEEIDFCTRAKKKGFALHWCQESVVLHKGGSSVGRGDSGNRSKIAFANYHENLSTQVFTRRFHPRLLPFALLFRFFGKLAVIGRRGDWYLAGPLWAAYIDFFTGKNRREKTF